MFVILSFISILNHSPFLAWRAPFRMVHCVDALWHIRAALQLYNLATMPSIFRKLWKALTRITCSSICMWMILRKRRRSTLALLIIFSPGTPMTIQTRILIISRRCASRALKSRSRPISGPKPSSRRARTTRLAALPAQSLRPTGLWGRASIVWTSVKGLRIIARDINGTPLILIHIMDMSASNKATTCCILLFSCCFTVDRLVPPATNLWKATNQNERPSAEKASPRPGKCLFVRKCWYYRILQKILNKRTVTDFWKMNFLIFKSSRIIPPRG